MLRLMIFSFLFTSCLDRSKDYVHYKDPIYKPTKDEELSLSLINMDAAVDILWVVDNSGSMGDIQNNIIKNTELFMNQFVKLDYIDWKMGVVSTDRSQAPYIGFKQPLDSSLVDISDASSVNRVVSQFQSAIKALGTNGSASEYVFYNTLRHIEESYLDNNTANFIRESSHVAVIMVTDEKEQSDAQYKGEKLYNAIKSYMDPGKTLRFYGVFQAQDLQDCSRGFSYKDSDFYEIVYLSEGFSISACSTEFGQDLVGIADDITSLIGKPALLLDQNPKVHTIKLYYDNFLLAGGSPEQSAYWFYNPASNTIEFYNLDFIKEGRKARFRIQYDIDDGVIRPGDPEF